MEQFSATPVLQYLSTGVLKINVFKIQVRDTKENMYEL